MKGKVRFGFIFSDGEKVCCRDVFDIEGVTMADAKMIFQKFKQDTMERHVERFGDMTTEDLASILNICPATIQLWIKRNGLPYIVKTAKGYRFNKETTFSWIREYKKTYTYLLDRYEERENNNGK